MRKRNFIYWFNIQRTSIAKLKPKVQNSIQVSHMGRRDTKTKVMSLCFQGHIRRKLVRGTVASRFLITDVGVPSSSLTH